MLFHLLSKHYMARDAQLSQAGVHTTALNNLDFKASLPADTAIKLVSSHATSTFVRASSRSRGRAPARNLSAKLKTAPPS